MTSREVRERNRKMAARVALGDFVKYRDSIQVTCGRVRKIGDLVEHQESPGEFRRLFQLQVGPILTSCWDDEVIAVVKLN